MDTKRKGRTETINLGSRRHQAKVLGTILIVLGAMVMTMVKGSILFGTVGAINHGQHGGSHTIVGLIFILLGCTSFAYSSILQTILINEYHFPALSLVSTNSFLGSIGGLIVAWIVESQPSYTVWKIFRWDLTLLSIIYAGVFCTGIGYYLEGVVMQARGPVYVSSFGPLCMIFVAVLEVFLLGEQLLLGRLIGAVVICVGLYCALWGRARDVTRSSQDARDENHIP
ncbi:auxin-induced protein 5ng4-like [Trifolium pratense]|uniref:WAT1-related protein n=1 Tax=Trifolium pratense TaxID=57577 RepID=A0A2K3MQR1_TRIPR|nr:auxin-induced protein 5ng4-like [Trifolium pratense]